MHYYTSYQFILCTLHSNLACHVNVAVVALCIIHDTRNPAIIFFASSVLLCLCPDEHYRLFFSTTHTLSQTCNNVTIIMIMAWHMAQRKKRVARTWHAKNWLCMHDAGIIIKNERKLWFLLEWSGYGVAEFDEVFFSYWFVCCFIYFIGSSSALGMMIMMVEKIWLLVIHY